VAVAAEAGRDPEAAAVVAVARHNSRDDDIKYPEETKELTGGCGVTAQTRR